MRLVGFSILTIESELFPSASTKDVTTERIQEDESEENHDYPPFTLPIEHLQATRRPVTFLMLVLLSIFR